MTTIYEALAGVMADVAAVKKTDRNDAQRFMFRGIDAVLNAVGPALRKHKVIVSPRVDSYDYGTVTTAGGKPMAHVRVMVTYTFYGPDGDSVPAQAPGEAFDAGDKATPKAMSVAYRTALLQALALPTDEPDPDTHIYQREDPPVPTVDELIAAAQGAGSNDELSRIARTAVAVLSATDVAHVKAIVTARREELKAAS